VETIGLVFMRVGQEDLIVVSLAAHVFSGFTGLRIGIAAQNPMKSSVAMERRFMKLVRYP
jgi:hypothetical protein